MKDINLKEIEKKALLLALTISASDKQVDEIYDEEYILNILLSFDEEKRDAIEEDCINNLIAEFDDFIDLYDFKDKIHSTREQVLIKIYEGDEFNILPDMEKLEELLVSEEWQRYREVDLESLYKEEIEKRKTMEDIGLNDGDVCNRGGCEGTMQAEDVDTSCSCHINPPCSHCVDRAYICDRCEFNTEEDGIWN